MMDTMNMDEALQNAPQKGLTERLIEVVTAYPGSTYTEIAERVGHPATSVSSRLYTMERAKSPQIKISRVDGAMRFFPVDFKLTEIVENYAETLPKTSIVVGNEPVKVIRLNADELRKFEEDNNKKVKPKRKYQELVDLCAEMSVGEAVFLLKTKVVKDTLSHDVRAALKDKTFSFSRKGVYVVIQRLT